MSTAQTTDMPPETIAKALATHLFPDDGELLSYAVLDGASVPDLLDQLYGDEPPEFVCLYRGELDPDLAEVAPYLVQLSPESAFTKWLLENCLGNHWGIFVTSTEDIETLRRHFRNFLMVKNPEGKQVYFRFYDPRVLRVFLPTCKAEEMETLFGPLDSYLCEAVNPDTLLSFSVEDGLPQCKPVKLFQ